MTYDEMLDIIRQDETIDVENYNRTSTRKTLLDLYQEVVERDVVLLYLHDKKRVARCSTSAVVFAYSHRHNCRYIEIGREFPSGDKVMKRKSWSLSETRKLDEDMTDAALRGLREEWKLEVTKSDLHLSILNLQEYFIYPSTAYPGIWTYSMTSPFELPLFELPWPEEIKEVYDNGTKIFIQRVPLY